MREFRLSVGKGFHLHFLPKAAQGTVSSLDPLIFKSRLGYLQGSYAAQPDLKERERERERERECSR